MSVGVKARVGNRKQVDVAPDRSGFCSLHATVRAALRETVVTVSLRTVPRLSRQSCHLRVGKETRRGGLAASLRLCGIVSGSFQETAPRKTTKNTVKHRDGGVGSVVHNHRDGSESSVVVTTLVRSTAGNTNF